MVEGYPKDCVCEAEVVYEDSRDLHAEVRRTYHPNWNFPSSRESESRGSFHAHLRVPSVVQHTVVNQFLVWREDLGRGTLVDRIRRSDADPRTREDDVRA